MMTTKTYQGTKTQGKQPSVSGLVCLRDITVWE